MPFAIRPQPSEKDFRMKVLFGSTACLFALLLCQGCTGKEESSSGTHKETGGGKTQAEALVEKIILELANANTDFPKSKDPQSILRFYTQDYSGIDDGKGESLKDIQKSLSDVLERINLGEPIGVSARVANIKSNVTGTFGWATYDYEYKVGRGGVVMQSDQGKCTDIFRKQGDSWLIQHEHCSTVNPFPLAR
jgi:ketosteroid isomerase-like protein